MENIEIRFATSDDFRQVREFDPHSEYIDPEKIKNKLYQNEIVIAEMEKKNIGILKFSYFWSTRPYVDLIYVDASNRKHGVGSQLMTFLERYLVKEGYCYLYISAQENEPEALNWHKKQGFVECGKLDAINLPQENVAEIFLYKRIAEGDPRNDKLRKYKV